MMIPLSDLGWCDISISQNHFCVVKVGLGKRSWKKRLGKGCSKAIAFAILLLYHNLHHRQRLGLANGCMKIEWQRLATHCNTFQEPSGKALQHTAIHCNTLQHTATHCNTLQHTATHCNTLQHSVKIEWQTLGLAKGGLHKSLCQPLPCGIGLPWNIFPKCDLLKG